MSDSQPSKKAKSAATPAAPLLVKDGGPQIFPPLALPAPHELQLELKAWKPQPALRRAGLGLFAALCDVDVLKFLRYLTEPELVALGQCSKWWWLVANDDERWKRLTILRNRGNFRFKGSWRRTCLLPRHVESTRAPPDIRLEGFYSRYMYELHYRSFVSMDHFRGVPREAIDRRHNLSPDEFRREYLAKNKPVVVSGVLDKWRARSAWTIERLMAEHGSVRFKTDEVDADSRKFKMRFDDYVKYMYENHDEDPIYLFDPCFDERVPQMLQDYHVPRLFPEDFFAVLGDDRPDFMWLVLGPERSGSPFHVDPYRTSAWNAVLEGQKRWLLYPPNVDPPGVPVDDDTDDGIDYDAPEPIKYLVEEYPFIPEGKEPLECIMGPGDIIFVPSGWWHMVLNLSPCVAVTQNFCDSHNIKMVLDDMKLPSNKKIYKNFRSQLAPVRPDLAQKYGFSSLFHERTEC